MIEIDGSMGEGGGQIIRSSLSLSLITGTPFRIRNIRARRKRPGLLRQHLSAVNAAAEISSAKVIGAKIGSNEITFEPQKVVGRDYYFSIGSAGSSTLVLQTILPALIICASHSTITIEGGTHNPLAPPYDFLTNVYFSVLQKMSARISASLDSYGFYPAGGGKLRVEVNGGTKLHPISLLERGGVQQMSATLLLSRLPKHIAEREEKVIREFLENIDVVHVEEVPSPGPGNVAMIQIQSENVTELFSAFGEKRKPAERVAEEAVVQAKHYLGSGAAVGPHLADQLLLPFALAGGGSYSTMLLTQHTTTNIEVLKMFLDIEIGVEQCANQPAVVLSFKSL